VTDLVVVFALFVFMLALLCLCVATVFSVNKDLYVLWSSIFSAPSLARCSGPATAHAAGLGPPPPRQHQHEPSPSLAEKPRARMSLSILHTFIVL